MAKRRLKRIEDWEGKFEGERCFVLGNGRNLLDDIDPEWLIGEYTFATNRIGALWNYVKPDLSWRPTFYVLTSNQMVSRQSWRRDCISAIQESEVVFANPINKKVIPDELYGDIWWLRELRHEGMDNEKHVPDDFWSENPANWISKFGTSWLPMMQLAVWMGFDPIIIVGCDQGFIGYKNDGKTPDPNHFYDEYDGEGYTFDNRIAQMVMNRVPAAHDLVKRVTTDLGVSVLNLGTGPMNIWPRVTAKELWADGEEA